MWVFEVSQIGNDLSSDTTISVILNNLTPVSQFTYFYNWKYGFYLRNYLVLAMQLIQGLHQ